MRPKTTASPDQLRSLVERQATSFQSVPTFWSINWGDAAIGTDPSCAEHEQSYRAASGHLKSLLEFPEFDDETGRCQDAPDLPLSWRALAICRNRIFPPKVRLQSYRTYLPEDLADQIACWKAWIKDVSAGAHRLYLQQLWAHETSWELKYYCCELRRTAEASLEKTAAWARKPEFMSIRDDVLAFPVPSILPAPVFPTQQHLPDAESRPDADSVWRQVEQLVKLTRAWDSKVKGKWKLRYYENFYESFDQFLGRANSDRLREFFGWADRCCERERGLFLDY